MKRILASLTLLLIITAAHAADKRPMAVEDLWRVKRVGPPSIAPDGKWVVVEVTTFDIDKDDSTSQLWLLATDGKAQKQLTNHSGKNSGPRWSADGKSIAFTSKRGSDEHNQIYLVHPDGGEARRLSNMPMAPSGLKWGADSKTLYCIAWTWPDAPDDDSYRKKEKAEKEKKSKALIVDDATFRYWDHWIADGKRPMVFAVDVATGKHKNLLAGTKLSLPPYEPTASDYDVAPDGKELCIVADSAKEIGMDVNYDLYTLPLDKKGEPKNITADNPANDHSPAYSPDGKQLAFLRTKTKFFYADRARLMLRDRASSEERELTADLDRTCASPQWLPDGRRIAVEIEDGGYVNIGFVDSESGKVVVAKESATERSISFAKQIRMGAYLRSTFDRPATAYVHGPGFEPRQIDHFNDDLVAQWQLGEVKNMTIKGADDRDVQMWVVYPPNFDPKKKWPLVQVVHGGPHNGITSDFSFRWNLQLWAAQGWVVGCVNFHGSSGFGQQFTDSITGDLGTKPMIDIMKATDWFVEQPYIDKGRIAAAGASYGGYMMAWLNGHTDRFKAMVCHAGVYNWHSMLASDIIRGRERSLGAPPWGDMEKIDRQSPQRFAANFKTPTLVIHGEKDFRVPVTQGLEYYNTLRQKGVPTRLVYFPDENHWVLKAQNSLLWHREVFGWLSKYVGNGPSK
jgi:dipeptidyl aminopeptidase/acylaminoacyl peptidase